MVESPGQKARVGQNAYGKSLVAAEDTPSGVAVAQFRGPLVLWEDVPESEVAHALLVDDVHWMIAQSDARYVNHACTPNCTIDDDLNVVTTTPVMAGREFTIAYNNARRSEYEAMPEAFWWDDRWSFDCACGTDGCQGRVAGYRLIDD